MKSVVEVDARDVTSCPLPRLLYVADLPVTGALAGAAALYRLLADYPADRLRIALSNLAVGPGYLGAPGLPGVAHDEFILGNTDRLARRAARLYRWYLLVRAPMARHRVLPIAREFRPEGILTVCVGYSWRLAAALARELEIPFYLVSHDQWQVSLDVPPWLKPLVERWFRDAYRQAVARFCVSPYMARAYTERYGAPATVLYPARTNGAPTFTSPPERVRVGKPSNFVFAGSVYPRTAELLAQLARALAVVDCTLTIYCPLSAAELQSVGLDRPNIAARPVVRTEDLVYRLREDADVLVAPMSFDSRDRTNIEVAFPSKLADYTATGLPILVWGPPYCSAVRWSEEQGHVAAVVKEPSIEALLTVVRPLLTDGAYRVSLGERALAVGARLFTYDAALREFRGALRACAPGTAFSGSSPHNGGRRA